MSRRESDESVLADRLVNYADALVAVTFLGVSGLGIAVADPDIRCTVAEGSSYVVAGNLGNAVLFTVIILLLRRWEKRLRADDPPSDLVVGYARWLHVARLVILWISTIAATLLAMRAPDASCAEEAWRQDASVIEAPAVRRPFA